jgi:chemotaxis protein histidine kinase CheA
MYESVIMQAASQSFSSSTTELILAISALVGVVATILTSVAAFMKAGRAKDVATAAGQAGTLGAQKTVEFADRIRNILAAGYNLSPEEAKTAADRVVPEMDKLTQQIKTGTEQVRVVKDNLPIEARADSVNMPREKFSTKPGSADFGV